MSKPFYPRNDYCLIKIVELGATPSGIALPDYAIAGKKFVVEAMGEKVEDLDIGDSVLMKGQRGVEYYELPNRPDLLVIKQEFIVLVIEDEA